MVYIPYMEMDSLLEAHYLNSGSTATTIYVLDMDLQRSKYAYSYGMQLLVFDSRS